MNEIFHHVAEKSTQTIRAHPKTKLFSISIFRRRACVLWPRVCCGASGWRFLNRHSFEWNHFRHSPGTLHHRNGRRRPYFHRTNVTRTVFPQISQKFNTKGALWGSIVSIVVVSFIAVGAQINIYKGNLLYETLPLSIESCDAPTRIDAMT